MSEILAPAGDKNSALAAINNGADAIYIGLKRFSARSSAENFDEENFREIIFLAHAFNVKVYVAMNTLVTDREKADFLSAAVSAWNNGADAIILSDVFLGAFIKKNFPEIELHLSTQAGVCNSAGALFAKKCGFSRVIAARETSFEDIKEIASIIETEVFVQGALCTCFSGQCYFSSFAGGNSGNRGKCKQPCRKRYRIDREGFDDEAYRISLSDLCVGRDIKELENAGVHSFKIEGRMRRPEYVAAAVSYYVNVLKTNSEVGLSALKRTFNRGNYTRGLAFGQDRNFISSSVQGHLGEFFGNIKIENGKNICITDKKAVSGDGFKILRDGKEVCGAVCSGNCKKGVILSASSRLLNGDKAFITTDIALNEELLKKMKKIPVTVCCRLFSGKVAEIKINGMTFRGNSPLTAAQRQPVDEESLRKCFAKVDKYPFAVNFGELLTNGVFIPASELNALRREVFAGYFAAISDNCNKKYEASFSFPEIQSGRNKKTAVISTDLNGVAADVGILKLNDCFEYDDKLIEKFSGEKYLYLPPFLTGKEYEKIKSVAENFDGIYCEGLYGFILAEQINKPLFAGTGLNIGNSVAVAGCAAKYIALSKELTVIESDEIKTEICFYQGAGNLKLMDLIYCPFEKKCKTCDRRSRYVLTDENGRKFPLRRYKTDECRFEVFNCANLVTSLRNGVIVDCTLEEDVDVVVDSIGDEKKLMDIFRNYTRGHSVQPIK